MSDPTDSTTSDTPQLDSAPITRPWNAGRAMLVVIALILALSLLYGLATAGWRWEKAQGGLDFEARDFVRRWFLRSTVAEILLIWWVVAVSGTVGSFLNVVVYRMPRGLSLSRSGSHCVHCHAPIQWYDNQPVIGWFILRGQCRNCHGPISGRYPLVEFMAVVVGLFLFLLVVQTTIVGPPASQANSWQQPIGYYFWLLEPLPIQRLLMFLYLLVPTMACLAIGWASFDGARLPLRFYISTITLIVASSVLYEVWLGQWLARQLEHPEWREVQFLSPSLRDWVVASVGNGIPAKWLGSPPRWSVLLIGQGCGGVIGAAIGGLFSVTFGRLLGDSSRVIVRQAPAIFFLIGVVGGWFLPLAVGLLWAWDVLVRYLRSLFKRDHHSSIEPIAVWFGLPFYLLGAIAVWRWFP